MIKMPFINHGRNHNCLMFLKRLNYSHIKTIDRIIIILKEPKQIYKNKIIFNKIMINNKNNRIINQIKTIKFLYKNYKIKLQFRKLILNKIIK